MQEPITKEFKKDNNINEVYRILSRYGLIDGYYEFETLDPDNNRLEVTTEIR